MGSQRNQEERAQDTDQETCVAELTREVNDVEKRNEMNAKFRAKYIWRFTLYSWTQTPETWLGSSLPGSPVSRVSSSGFYKSVN